MKIIFMGTSGFAVPTVKKIFSDKDLQLVAIFTAEPKPTGRGMSMQSSPVAQIADQYNIPKYELKTLRNREAFDIVSNIDADVIVVASYGLIIPESMLNMKKYGCINIHPSLLPKYRGPAPMQWVIINGESETGVCTMKMNAGVDTGDILLKTQFPLDDTITYHELHNLCADIGANLLLETLYHIDTIKPKRQPKDTEYYARKITKEDGRINWYNTAKVISCKVRGMNPWPSTYFIYNNKIIKILSANCLKKEHKFKPGTIIDENFTIACSDGIVEVNSLQIECKNPMSVKEFLNGNNIQPNIVLS